MTTVTAATGRYGRLVIEALQSRGMAANDIVAAVGSPGKAADLAVCAAMPVSSDHTMRRADAHEAADHHGGIVGDQRGPPGSRADLMSHRVQCACNVAAESPVFH